MLAHCASLQWLQLVASHVIHALYFPGIEQLQNTIKSLQEEKVLYLYLALITPETLSQSDSTRYRNNSHNSNHLL